MSAAEGGETAPLAQILGVRHILRYPAPRLREKSVAVERVDDGIRQLVERMTRAMHIAGGAAGLAAVQIGEPLRVFILDSGAVGLPEEDPPLVFINPEIVDLSKEQQMGDEGCLSFPDIFVPVRRSVTVRVRALDAAGRPFEVSASGFFARAIQHEHDHLESRLLIDHVGPMRREMIKRKLAQARRGP